MTSPSKSLNGPDKTVILSPGAISTLTTGCCSSVRLKDAFDFTWAQGHGLNVAPPTAISSLLLSPDKVNHMGSVLHDCPGFVIHEHANQNVAGEHLFFDVLPGTIFAELDRRGLGNFDLKDPVRHIQRVDPLLQNLA